MREGEREESEKDGEEIERERGRESCKGRWRKMEMGEMREMEREMLVPDVLREAILDQLLVLVLVGAHVDGVVTGVRPRLVVEHHYV
jgi:hypothetical protein